QRRVYGFAYQHLRDLDEAYDLTQEIFVKLYRNLARYDAERPFEPWFWKLAANTTINYRRKRVPTATDQSADQRAGGTESQGALACARVRVLLETYVDGDLAVTDPRAAQAVREHLMTCADCRRQHEQAVSLPYRMKALRSPAPPAGLITGVMSSIAPAPQASRWAWGLLVPEALLGAFILWY